MRRVILMAELRRGHEMIDACDEPTRGFEGDQNDTVTGSNHSHRYLPRKYRTACSSRLRRLGFRAAHACRGIDGFPHDPVPDQCCVAGPASDRGYRENRLVHAVVIALAGWDR